MHYLNLSSSTYLFLDILSVRLIGLLGGHKIESSDPIERKVPEELREAHVSKLMDFITESIKEYIHRPEIREKITSNNLEVGFAFSFPVSQKAINSGTLIRWTKGYSCPGARGEDIVRLLQTSIDNNINNNKDENVKVNISKHSGRLDAQFMRQIQDSLFMVSIAII